MKTIFAIVLVLIFCYSCGSQQEVVTRDNSYFVVEKIKRDKNAYVIYIRKKSEHYIILSEKQKVDKSGYLRIRRGGIYEFDTTSLLDEFAIKLFRLTSYCIDTKVIGPEYMTFKGEDVEIKTKMISDILEASNLKGLYIREQDVIHR